MRMPAPSGMCMIEPGAIGSDGLDNLTPADVYFGRGQAILEERNRIKRQTIANHHLQHQLQAA